MGAIGVHGLARELDMPDHDPYPALGLPRTQSALALLDLPGPGDDEDDDTGDSGRRAHAIPFRVSEEMDKALTAHAAALGTRPSTVIAHVFAVELDMPDHDPYRRLAKVVMQMAV